MTLEELRLREALTHVDCATERLRAFLTFYVIHPDETDVTEILEMVNGIRERIPADIRRDVDKSQGGK